MEDVAWNVMDSCLLTVDWRSKIQHQDRESCPWSCRGRGTANLIGCDITALTVGHGGDDV